MATRIRVRKGDTEVEYEGSEQFLKTELASLLEAASTFPAGSGSRARPVAGAAPPAGASSKKTVGRKRTAAGTPPARTVGAKTRAAAGSAGPAGGSAPGGPGTSAPAASPTADIARRIGCKHGTDLVLAASAQLNLGAGQRVFLAGRAARRNEDGARVLRAGLRQEPEPVPQEPDQGTAAQRAAPRQLRPDRDRPPRAGEDSRGVVPIVSSP